MIDNKDRKDKCQLITNICSQLKSEFVGIDEQIDELMNVLKLWYIYPELQAKPCVVNLIGMSGCGKTSLINRAVELLGIKEKTNYINFANISELTCSEVESKLREEVCFEDTANVFIYDEFQYASTLDSNGNEITNKNALKVFWELMDTGHIHFKMPIYIVTELSRMKEFYGRVNNYHPIELDNGKWMNYYDCLEKYDHNDIQTNRKCINSVIVDDLRQKNDSTTSYKDLLDEDGIEKFFAGYKILDIMQDAFYNMEGRNYDFNDIAHMFNGMSFTEFYEWLTEFVARCKTGMTLNFHNSLVVVIANLDEAYDVAFNVNPDMSPDQFHHITKKISVVDIKRGLQKRFRNEQIARMGNTYVIYPAFNSDSFREIIKQDLDRYAMTAYGLTGLNVRFDDKIQKAIYNESVFPTQGARPIYSTINEIIKSKLPLVISRIDDDHLSDNACSIEYSYYRGKLVIKVLDCNDKQLALYKFTDKWRIQSLRDSKCDDAQANTAVHESGHFVLYMYLNGKIPEKIVTQSVDKKFGGFVLQDTKEGKVTSKMSLLHEIKVCLGGYVAESLVFGEMRRSAGSSQDLETATAYAANMIRKYGFYGNVASSTVTSNSPECDSCKVENEAEKTATNDIIDDIIKKELEKVETILKMPNVWKVFIKVSKYLSTHTNLTKREMQKYLDEIQPYNETYSYRNELFALSEEQ